MSRLVLCLAVINNAIFSLGVDMLGPADLVFKTFEHCDPPNTDINVWISQKKYNRTVKVLDLAITTPFPIGEGAVIELNSEIKKDGGYKPGGFYLKDKACVVLSTMLGDMFTAFLAAAGVDDCPLPEGQYDIDNFFFDNDAFNVPQVYGEYRVTVQVFYEDMLRGCYILYIDFTPKQRAM